MTARVTVPGPQDTTPAPNRAARRAARHKEATDTPAAGLPVTHRAPVSTKPAHHRADYAARRSG